MLTKSWWTDAEAFDANRKEFQRVARRDGEQHLPPALKTYFRRREEAEWREQSDIPPRRG